MTLRRELRVIRLTNNISVDTVTATTVALLKTGITNWIAANQNKIIVGEHILFEALLGTTNSYSWVVLYMNSTLSDEYPVLT